MSHFGCVTQRKDQHNVRKRLKLRKIHSLLRCLKESVKKLITVTIIAKYLTTKASALLPGSQTETKAEGSSAISHQTIKRHCIDMNVFRFITPFQSFTD